MRLEYDRTADTLTESFGVGGTAKIEGLEQDQSGHVFYDKLTYETISRDGTMTQVYEEGRLQRLSYEYPDHSVVKYECLRDVRCVDEGGNIENGTIRIDLPGHLDPETPPDPQHPPIVTPPDFSIFFNVVAGRVAEASVETKVVSAPQSQTATQKPIREQDLFVLVNGINNTSGDPGYLRELRNSIGDHAGGSLDPIEDFILAATYKLDPRLEAILITLFGPSQAPPVIKQIYDMWRTVAARSGDTQVVADVKDAIENFFNDKRTSYRERGMVGVGYSGGFVPLVNAVAEGRYNMNSFVALGAATFGIGADLARAIVQTIHAMENVATMRNDHVRAGYEAIVGTLGHLLKGAAGLALLEIERLMKILDEFYRLTDKSSLDQKFSEFYETLTHILDPFTGFNWNNISVTHPELVVNIWGSKDELLPLRLGGYLDHIGQYSVSDPEKPLFNIEIEGGHHLDYINHIRTEEEWENEFPDQIEREGAKRKNADISRYVAQLILNAKDASTLSIYLTQLSRDKILVQTGPNTYKLRIL